MPNVLASIVDGVFIGTVYGLFGACVMLVVATTKRFHFAFGATFGIAAYVAAQLSTTIGLLSAILVGITAAIIVGVLIERFLYEPIQKLAPRSAEVNIFVVSFAVVVVVASIVQLIWTSDSSVRRIHGFEDARYEIGAVDFTALDLITAAASVVGVFVLAYVLKSTSIGAMVRAVRSNPELAVTQRISIRRVHMFVFAFASGATGLLGVLAGIKVAATPYMGTTPTLFGFIVAFLVGISLRVSWALPVGIGLGILESLASLVLSPQLAVVVVFGVLVVYLIQASVRRTLRVQ